MRLDSAFCRARNSVIWLRAGDGAAGGAPCAVMGRTSAGDAGVVCRKRALADRRGRAAAGRHAEIACGEPRRAISVLVAAADMSVDGHDERLATAASLVGRWCQVNSTAHHSLS